MPSSFHYLITFTDTETQTFTQVIPDSIESFSTNNVAITQQSISIPSSISSISTVTPFRRKISETETIDCVCELPVGKKCCLSSVKT